MTRLETDASGNAGSDGRPELLHRRLGVGLLTLYGLSVTVGAGIYVLIGETVSRAGAQAPLAFLCAALLVSLSAASYAVLSTRFPVSAGEAVYVENGLGLRWLALIVGLLVCLTGIVSSATLLRGGVGYVNAFVALPAAPIQISAALLLGGIAAWGISQTAWTAAILAVAELSVLIAIAAVGFSDLPAIATTAAEAFFVPDSGHLIGLSSATLIAFFAFIGFEDMVNVAEEVKNPKKTLPAAIFLTLLITAILYVLVVLVALTFVDREALSASDAPLALVASQVLPVDGKLISLIAIAAVGNGILIQVVMASRVIYGLSRMGVLPSGLGTVSPRTHTPLVATGLVVAVVLALSFAQETAALADLTSSITLIVFALVNLSLWRLGRRLDRADDGLRLPQIVPLLGFVTSLAFLAFEWMSRLTATAGL